MGPSQPLLVSESSLHLDISVYCMFKTYTGHSFIFICVCGKCAGGRVNDKWGRGTGGIDEVNDNNGGVVEK